MAEDLPGTDARETAPGLNIPDYASSVADYAPSSGGFDADACGGALVTEVRPESPADDAGILPGMRVLTVNGRALTDMIVWLWEADGAEVDLTVFDGRDGTTSPCTLERWPGEDWGLTFDGPVFDGMRTCVNGCIFCFMSMLPPHMRNTLYIRDDDYRLSFLQGNFVTLTNMSDEDVSNVIDHALSPMNVSIHAVSPEARQRLMGRNAQRGMDVLEQLIQAGIEIHGQIVLCPGINDGEELERTLTFCESHEEVTSLGIVPLGYTRYSKHFSRSYSDDPAAARAVIEQVRPYQERARARCGRTIFQLSDEFYLDAHVEVPPAESYDGYPQFYDGIGMVRSFLDDADEILGSRAGRRRLKRVVRALARRGERLVVVSGEASRDTVAHLVEDPLLGGEVWAVRNGFFGGNVDVTGLICGCDLLEQLPADLGGTMLFVPSIMFNASGDTLDGYHRVQLLDALGARGASVHVAPTTPWELLEALEEALGIVPASKRRSSQ